jgi:hypothetical protein
MDIDALLKKAQWQKIAPAELKVVLGLICSGEHDDLYTLLHILGRAGSREDRKVMERYLRYPLDPMISALALKSLCRWWGLFSDYRAEVLCFLGGVEWDADGDIKLEAIGLAGEYLRHNSDREILKAVYDIYCDQQQRNVLRSAAYFALCRSEGLEWKDLPPASRPVDFARVDKPLLARVEQKIRSGLT